MTNYKEMYYVICNAASKAIDAPLKNTVDILQNALREAEEIYLETCGEEESESR